MIQPKSLLDVGQEKISKPCILDGIDENVAGGGDDEEEVGEVDQPGLVQRDWGTFECHNHLIYVEASPWGMAKQLYNDDCQEQSFH